MADRLIWTDAASADLAQATEYIARDSLHYAKAFAREAVSAAETLTLFPEAGAIVPEFNNPNLREIFVKRYRLIYRVADDSVRVVAFFHGARDLKVSVR